MRPSSAGGRLRSQRGFTVAEIVATMAVTATVLGAGVVTYIGTLRSWEGTSRLARIQRDAALAMDVVAARIRAASYVEVGEDADSLSVYLDAAGGDSLMAVYYQDECALVDADGGVVVPCVSAVQFSSADGTTVNIDITLVDDMGTPDNPSDDQSTLMSSTVACMN